MSLRVWLPLNGDFHNQGLDGEIDFTLYGTITDSQGKIGQCKEFDGTSGLVTPSFSTITLGNTASLCCWVNFNSFRRDNEWLISLGIAKGGYDESRMGIATNAKGTKIAVIIGGAYDSSFEYPFETEKWYHLALIWNTDKLILYINGLQKNIYTTLTPTKFNITRLSLASNTYNSTTKLNGKLNDVRFYDHALSAKEVKEISKGLILHYKLNQNINILNNCYKYPTFNTSTANGGWSHWGSTNAAIGTYGQNTDKLYIYNKNNTYSHWVANDSEATADYLLYQSPSFSGGSRSLQVIAKEKNGLPITSDIFYPAWNGNSSTYGTAINHIWTSISSLGDGFYLCKTENIGQDGSNNLIGFYVQAGYKIYISEAYCENDRKICSDIFFQKDFNIIYDSSGYNNNGTIYGNILSDSSSARYNNCLYIPSGNTDYIVTNNTIGNPLDQITMNIWFKSTNTNPINNYHMLFNVGDSAGSFEMAIYKTGYFRAGIYINNTRYVANTAVANLLDGNWHMLSMTYDGHTIVRYIDGIAKSTTSVEGTITYNNKKFMIGRRGTDTDYYMQLGYVSDARIYATALSAKDVLLLYNTSVSIDKNGNIYARLVIEI